MLKQFLIVIFLTMCLRESNAYADDKDKALHFAAGYAISYTASHLFKAVGIKKGPASILGTLVGISATVGKELSDPVMDKEDLKWGCAGSMASGIINITLDLF